MDSPIDGVAEAGQDGVIVEAWEADDVQPEGMNG